eukprot:gene1330-1676_t
MDRIEEERGAGFIGSHLTIHISENYPEYNVIVIDKLDYCGSIKNLSSIINREKNSNFTFYKGNIMDPSLLHQIFKNHSIDTVIHLAASSHVDPFTFTNNNYMGTHVLLECCRQYHQNISRFIYFSTDEVYGGENSNELNENTILQPTNPYSASKAAADLLVQSYFKSFNIPTIITRSNNVYGPFQYPEKIIPKFISLLSNKNPW